MTKTLKIAAVAAVAALGLASTALAQQSSAQKPNMSAEQHRQMMSGGMQHRQMMGMTDPKMGQQMMQMMGNMPRTDATPRS